MEDGDRIDVYVEQRGDDGGCGGGCSGERITDGESLVEEG